METNERPALHHITVTMDSVEGFFSAWTDGSTWNGFACPLFERKVALVVASDLEDMSYRADQDAFIWHPEDMEEPEVFSGFAVQLPDGRTATLYPIGTGGWCWQAVDIDNERSRRMSIDWIPCAPGDHIGELMARTFIINELENTDGILLTNYHHPVNNGTEEHDLLLINEWGIWALEVKHWHGQIEADDVFWLHKGQRYPSPVVKIEGKARNIAETLRGAGFEKPSVVGMVILTTHGARFKIYPSDKHKRKVFRLTWPLIEALTSNDFSYHKNYRLTPTQIEQVRDILLKRKVDPQRRIIGNFRLMREMEPGATFNAYEAQHVHLTDRRARAKQYKIDQRFTNKKELDMAAERFQQDVKALLSLQGHSGIVIVYDFYADPDSYDTYWLFLEWVEGLTLRERLEMEDAISFKEQLRILQPVAAALTACHEKGVLHRNLIPSSIYLADDGHVKLGDFDFARVPGVSTISTAQLPHSKTWNRCTAPELNTGFRSADERSDLYSFGVIWYDMNAHLTDWSEEPVMQHIVDKTDLPEDAKNLLRSLLASQPENRIQSAQEVLDWINHWLQ